MDKIGRLDRILNEEDGDVIAHHIEIALVRVEFDRGTGTSRGKSPAPVPPATVEKRANTSVFLPFSARDEAFVRCRIGLVTSK